MQTCPNCGSETRAGSKFCTSCGYRFEDNGKPEFWGGTGAAGHVAAWGSNQPTADDGLQHEGWPAAPASAEPGQDDWGAATASAPAPDSDASASAPGSAGFWPEPATDSWPSTLAEPEAAGEPDAPEEPSLQAHESQETEQRDARQGPQAQALDLLEQLRTVIMLAGTTGSGDLSGVIADLEVAATPPGAMPPDELSDLRDALFAARENPRDVDTIVDLTKRIGVLVALVIAYDRALAAIERSLDALRNEGDKVSG